MRGMHFIKEGRYLPEDDPPELEVVKKVHKNNVELYETCSSDRPADFQSPLILSIRALQNIDVCKVLTCDYDNPYTCNTLLIKLQCVD